MLSPRAMGEEKAALQAAQTLERRGLFPGFVFVFLGFLAHCLLSHHRPQGFQGPHTAPWWSSVPLS